MVSTRYVWAFWASLASMRFNSNVISALLPSCRAYPLPLDGEYILKVAPVLQHHAHTAPVPTVLLGLLCPWIWGISSQSLQRCAGSHSLRFLPQPVILKKLKLNGSMNTYKDLLELRSKKDIIFTVGDRNAKVESQETLRVTGIFGLGVQNEAGQRLIEFCQENALVIANTLFQQHERRLYT